jgi:hypothetical protein
MRSLSFVIYSLLLYVSRDFRGMKRDQQGAEALREEFKGIDMPGPNDCEMAKVQRRGATASVTNLVDSAARLLRSMLGGK